MADFQENHARLDRLGIRVFALSVDDEQDANAMVREEGLAFPVGYGLDGEAVHESHGARIHPERGHIHATGFILRPDGTVQLSVYANGPIGRFTADEVAGMVKFWRSREEEG